MLQKKHPEKMIRCLSCVPSESVYSVEYIKDTRKKCLVLPEKPITQWTFHDAMTTSVPVKLPFALPDYVVQGIPLSLLHPPDFLRGNMGVRPFSGKGIYEITHAGEYDNDFQSLVSEHFVNEDKETKIYVLDKKRSGLSAKDEIVPYSHSFFINYTSKDEECHVSSITITFGRKNGCTNLASVVLPFYSGFLTSTEALFQARKATLTGNFDQAKVILESKSGFAALRAAGAQSLPMTEEQIKSWNSQSSKIMLLSKLVSLADPAFATWMDLIRDLTMDTKKPKVLFLEIGSPHENRWTCGMIGEEILEKLKEEGGFDELYAKFGPEQKTDTEMTNTSGVVVNKIFEIFCEGRDAGFFGWDSVCEPGILFTFDEKIGESMDMEKDQGSPKKPRIE